MLGGWNKGPASWLGARAQGPRAQEREAQGPRAQGARGSGVQWAWFPGAGSASRLFPAICPAHPGHILGAEPMLCARLIGLCP